MTVQGCVCGRCDEACKYAMFKPCCGACMIDNPHYDPVRDEPAAYWAAYLERHPEVAA